ncbi:hypothetical protein FZC83_05390 [Rossellomorea marisflavi]|uniref:Uncharacterized protein n=1 Tax=Rossellomorea marisflavi TaxID=189381 RepID=A0A5D4S091_9BACI|nr:hypothetical protein [Rossellomorea marisflavi]TYS56997.1 hypothetical protein FZC83_05390 [Rossellomorea marisflavi]
MENKAAKLTIESAVTQAQARQELNASIIKLRTKYGFAPTKGISVEAMRERAETLVEGADQAVEAYVTSTGRTLDRMKNRSRYVASKDFPKKKYVGLQEYANVPDRQLKKAPLHTAEAIGNLLNFNADYLLKAQHEHAVRERTRQEWSRMEYEYVEKSDYNLRDLYDDLMILLDDPVSPITVEEYRKERKKWKACKYYACDNYFPIAKDHMQSYSFKWTDIEARRSDSLYCCEECRKSQENALKRLEKTGTLLPEHAYEYILDDAREKKSKKEVPIERKKVGEIASL